MNEGNDIHKKKKWTDPQIQLITFTLEPQSGCKFNLTEGLSAAWEWEGVIETPLKPGLGPAEDTFNWRSHV